MQESTPHPLRPQQHGGATLAQLAEIAQAPLEPAAAHGLRISGVSLDSRTVQPGDLYLALPGAHAHGARFADAAVHKGAVAILTDDAGRSLLGDSLTVPVLTVTDARAVTGALAAAVYGGAPGLDLFAVTGTNGKTTTTYFLNSLLRALGKTTGLIGTIEILAGDEPVPSKLTTPESTDVHALLAVMAEKGLDAASMEVSSHALAFARVAGVKFGVAGFTNLTQDHLDLHGDMADYFATKAKLFTPEHAEHAVIIVDDEWGVKMAAAAQVPVVTLGTVAGSDAQWRLSGVDRDGLGHSFVLSGPDGRELRARTGLPGFFNVANAALALLMVATALLAKQPATALETLQRAMDAHDPFTVDVPGRMQLIGTAPLAVVDFAHNPDALTRAMEAVRPVDPQARLILVFGATGERDVTKRPIMGAVAVAGADVILVTDDDPHDEDPAAIRAHVVAGAREANERLTLHRVIEEYDSRAGAITRAVDLATPADVILVAGRGHEVFQEVKGVNLSLDDRVELRAALAARGFPLTQASTIESTTDD